MRHVYARKLEGTSETNNVSSSNVNCRNEYPNNEHPSRNAPNVKLQIEASGC